MVIAPFLDGNHYRAMVMNVQNDKAKIIYVDFGNINEVNVKELQALPDNLKIVSLLQINVFFMTNDRMSISNYFFIFAFLIGTELHCENIFKERSSRCTHVQRC